MGGKRHNDKNHRVRLLRPDFVAATFGTSMMLGVHFLVLGVWLRGGELEVNALYSACGLSFLGVLEGQLWQVLTHQWFHGGWIHLLVNSFLFCYASVKLSSILNQTKILKLFLLTSVAAGLAHVLSQVYFAQLRSGILVGASGGITGMLLAYFALSPESRMLFLPISARNLAKGFLISSALLFLMTPSLGLPLMASLGKWLSSTFKVEMFQWAHLVHFVGGAVGWVCVERFLPKLISSRDLEQMRQTQDSSLESSRDS